MLPARPGFDSSMARLSLLIIFGGSGYPLCALKSCMTFKSSACDIWLLRSRAPDGRPGESPGNGSAALYLTAAECIAEE
ncbi:MAG: hypothetical protein QOG17_3486 [Gammaproteobacteria bacterium]|nr:hypothetical protein [Gammaproteobacteria bacterium]